jgi:glycosyltransferase involved in cell wall biosynthesis
VNKKTEILLVTYEFPPEMATGGIGSYMNHLAHLLNSFGYHVIVFSGTTNYSQMTIVERNYCINYLVPADSLKIFREKVAEVFESYIQNHSVDVIESPEVGACALEIKKNHPHIPLVVKMHTPGVLITKISNTYQSIFIKLRFVAGALLRGKIDLGYWAKHDKNKLNDPEYLICEKADILLSPSQALKKWAIDFWQLPESKIKIVANPFTADSDLFKNPIERDTKTICFIGKLTVLKGMFSFTSAIKQVLAKHPDYRIIIVGRDEAVSENITSMKQWMMSRIGSSYLNNIIFTGALNMDEVKKVYAQSEICVVPSLWENYPTVVLESMAAGCAVVASDIGGISEMIIHKKNGWLFNPKKSSLIASGIIRLIENPEMRFRIATNARKSICEKSDEQFMKKVTSVYDNSITNTQKMFCK